jgi:hypothetical protein
MRRSAILLAILSACAGESRVAPPRSVSTGIEAAVRQAPDSPVVISRLTNFPWSRFFVFGPYTPAQAIRDSVGAGCCGGAEVDLASADDHDLLVFVRPDKPPFIERHLRNRGAFAPAALGRGYTSAEAAFIVSAARRDGWRTLEPVRTDSSNERRR